MSNKLQILETIKPQVAALSLKDVKIELDNYSPKAQVLGMTAIVDPAAHKDLLKISGLDSSSIERIRETSGQKGAELILRNAIKAIGERKLNFAFDGARITRIVDPAKKGGVAMQPAQVQKLAEMMISKGMQLYNVTPSNDGTQATIQIYNPNIWDHPQMKDESVTIGKSIHWDAMGGTSLHEFIQRMICSNGATTREDGQALTWLTPEMNPSTLYEMLFVQNEEKRMAAYFNRVQQLQEKLLSVREWQEMKKQLDRFGSDSNVIREHFGGDGPGKDGNWELENIYRKRGFDFENMTKDQLANAPTPFTWWDGINGLTWLASHETKSNVSDWEKARLQSIAGRMITRSKRDADAWLTGLPNFN